MKENNVRVLIISFAIIIGIAFIAFAICFLASLGYNSKLTVEKEKIEVITNQTSINQ